MIEKFDSNLFSLATAPILGQAPSTWRTSLNVFVSSLKVDVLHKYFPAA
ncbi:MAG: hypothetical protein GY792_27600 [Gammaproteobacteria bacterium]|nr:hypothetical protein [Gammaproteobacteria bacterium]